jgi:methylase of polypeptide subunit release factors
MELTFYRSGTNVIVDLCSGSGGPLINIQRDLKKYERFDVRVTLTDLFPPTAKVQKNIADRSRGAVNYYHVSQSLQYVHVLN